MNKAIAFEEALDNLSIMFGGKIEKRVIALILESNNGHLESKKKKNHIFFFFF